MNLVFEILKLIVQLVGAMIVARLAVNWALDRYKREKVWDRRLSCYSDIVTAIAEMLRVNNEWFDDAAYRRENVAEDGDRAMRYKEAKRKFLEVASSGRLLLPKQSTGVLQRLIHDIDSRPKFDFYEDALAHDASVLESALDELIELGQGDLGAKHLAY
ncbi:MAG: hypothetical protein V7686_00385 [Qipengyuania sp.]